MDNNPILPTGSGGLGGGGITSKTNIMIVLVGVLGFGAFAFAILAIVSFNTASTATKTLKDQRAEASAMARAEQKKADDAANTVANESPFRSYVAPVEYGSFEIKFPKNWSGSVDQERSGTQVALAVNPDFIRRSNADDELMAARITLIEKTVPEYTKTFTDKLTQGLLSQADVMVSGQKSLQFVGKFDNKKIARMIVVPVRDKVLVFTNENDKYSREFDQIIAQSNIVP